MLHRVRKHCPECQVTLTRYHRSQLWWISSGLSGRLVQPCPECGALLHLSAMRLLSMVGALALIGTSVVMFATAPTSMLLLGALLSALAMLGGVLGTRVEAVPRREPVAAAPGHPDAHAGL